MKMKNWNGQRILVLGAARQGLALARFLTRQGARVTLNDQRPVEKMASAREALSDLPVQWALGGHPLSLLDETDLVCLSGGIPLDLPIVIEAARRGLSLSNDSQIFMEAVPCRVIGITGSAGKTTTTTLVGRMAAAAVTDPRHAWIGGNIGQPLIEFLDEIQPEDTAILELSSFQLDQMTLSPQIAAVLNITPNHLDRHGTMEAYTAAKARLLEFQQAGDTAVLGRENPGAWALASRVRGNLLTFGLRHPPAGQCGTYCRDHMLWFWDGLTDQALLPLELVRLRGEHNLMNILAACALAVAAGFPAEAIQSGVRDFKGVAHRLEFIRMHRGVQWFNDSIATAPERTAAALRSFDEPVVLLLGGRDKNLPWEQLAELIRERVDHVVIFGEAAEKIQSALGGVHSGLKPYPVFTCSGLHEAVLAAAGVAEPGDVVLLSPGGTSFDEFKDFEERGECFRLWVNQLT